eukprot:g33917.t1
MSDQGRPSKRICAGCKREEGAPASPARAQPAPSDASTYSVAAAAQAARPPAPPSPGIITAAIIPITDGKYTLYCPRYVLARLPAGNPLSEKAKGLRRDGKIDLAGSDVEGLNAVVEREVRNYERNLVRGLRRCLACVVTAAELGEAMAKSIPVPTFVPPYVPYLPKLVLSNVAEPPVPLAEWEARLRCLQYPGLEDTFFLALIEPLQDLWEFLRGPSKQMEFRDCDIDSQRAGNFLLALQKDKGRVVMARQTLYKLIGLKDRGPPEFGVKRRVYFLTTVEAALREKNDMIEDGWSVEESTVDVENES